MADMSYVKHSSLDVPGIVTICLVGDILQTTFSLDAKVHIVQRSKYRSKCDTSRG